MSQASPHNPGQNCFEFLWPEASAPWRSVAEDNETRALVYRPSDTERRSSPLFWDGHKFPTFESQFDVLKATWAQNPDFLRNNSADTIRQAIETHIDVSPAPEPKTPPTPPQAPTPGNQPEDKNRLEWIWPGRNVPLPYCFIAYDHTDETLVYRPTGIYVEQEPLRLWATALGDTDDGFTKQLKTLNTIWMYDPNLLRNSDPERIREDVEAYRRYQVNSEKRIGSNKITYLAPFVTLNPFALAAALAYTCKREIGILFKAPSIARGSRFANGGPRAHMRNRTAIQLGSLVTIAARAMATAVIALAAKTGMIGLNTPIDPSLTLALTEEGLLKETARRLPPNATFTENCQGNIDIAAVSVLNVISNTPPVNNIGMNVYPQHNKLSYTYSNTAGEKLLIVDYVGAPKGTPSSPVTCDRLMHAFTDDGGFFNKGVLIEILLAPAQAFKDHPVTQAYLEQKKKDPNGTPRICIQTGTGEVIPCPSAIPTARRPVPGSGKAAGSNGPNQ